jgi:hypothetical protein
VTASKPRAALRAFPGAFRVNAVAIVTPSHDLRWRSGGRCLLDVHRHWWLRLIGLRIGHVWRRGRLRVVRHGLLNHHNLWLGLWIACDCTDDYQDDTEE